MTNENYAIVRNLICSKVYSLWKVHCRWPLNIRQMNRSPREPNSCTKRRTIENSVVYLVRSSKDVVKLLSPGISFQKDQACCCSQRTQTERTSGGPKYVSRAFSSHGLSSGCKEVLARPPTHIFSLLFHYHSFLYLLIYFRSPQPASPRLTPSCPAIKETVQLLMVLSNLHFFLSLFFASKLFSNVVEQ